MVHREKRDSLIKEKEKEIARLKAEIKELRGPAGIASLTKNHLCTATWSDGSPRPNSASSEEWQAIKRVCMIAFGASYVRDLTPEMMQSVAKMADEIIDIFNKYYKTFHK